MTLRFEWDPRKATANQRKHGVVFEEAETDMSIFFRQLAQVDAMVAYIGAGGAALFISDANFGQNWGDAPDSDRVRFIYGLRRELADVDFRVHGMLGSERVDGWRYVHTLSQAKGGLNANKHEQTLYSSDRIAGLMGNGLLCYIHRDSELDRFFDDDKAVFFSHTEDLASSVRAMRDDDARRRAVAEAGTRFYRRHFSSRLVTRFMVDAALEMPSSEDYIWPTQRF